jgi:hypothetical protein
MSDLTFEQLRLPAALILIIIVAFILLPRAGDEAPTSASLPADGLVSPTAGEPGGAVLETPAAASSESQAPEPTATPARTPRPTPTPVAGNGFAAEILACRSISGSSCNGPLGVLPAQATAFTALVRFTGATVGDAINVILAGPGGTIAGGPFTLQGSGDGYYYSTFTVAGLPTGRYTVTAIRNGSEVAQTSFRRGS